MCFRTENCQRKYNISTKYLVKRKRIDNVNLSAGFSTVNTEKHGLIYENFEELIYNLKTNVSK